MQIRFKSIQYPEKFGYLLDTNEYGRDAFISGAFFFETYGDGLTQHSGLCSVTFNCEVLADWIFSFCQHLHDNLDLWKDRELLSFLWCLARETSKPIKQMEFCSKLAKQFMDQKLKHRFYSLELFKTSDDHEKSHDRRWTERPYPSSFKGWNLSEITFNFFNAEARYHSPLRSYAFIYHLREFMDYPMIDEVFTSHTMPTTQLMRFAFEILFDLGEMAAAKERLTTHLSNLVNFNLPKKTAAAA